MREFNFSGMAFFMGLSLTDLVNGVGPLPAMANEQSTAQEECQESDAGDDDQEDEDTSTGDDEDYDDTWDDIEDDEAEGGDSLGR